MFRCQEPNCTSSFTRERDLKRHIKTVHGTPEFSCDACEKVYKRKDKLKAHKRKIHAAGTSAAPQSSSPIEPAQKIPRAEPNGLTEASLIPHSGDDNRLSATSIASSQNITYDNTDNDPDQSDISHSPSSNLMSTGTIPSPNPIWKVIQKKRAFRNSLISYEVQGKGRDPISYLQQLATTIDEKTEEYLKQETGVKICVCLHIAFYSPVDDTKKKDPHFWSKQIPILRGDVISDKVALCFPTIMKLCDEFLSEGSGWVVEKILSSEVHFARYHPLKGQTYTPLPREIRTKRAVLNIQNRDEKCFIWSVLASFHRVDNHPELVSRYEQYEAELDMTGIRTPVELKQIPRFERQNNVSVNVYGFENVLYPLYISDSDARQVNLLLYEGHYTLVRSLDRLLSDQRGGHRQKFFCHRCLIPMYSQERLDSHLSNCCSDSRTKMSDDEDIHFKSFNKMLKQPVVVYCDMECILEPIDPPDAPATTEKYQRHVPCGYGLLEARSCCGPASFEPYEGYRGPDCVKKLLISLQLIALADQERLNNAPELHMTPENLNLHEQSTCHICRKEIQNVEDKVRDHCHICGQYRGPAHNECNQAYRVSRDIVVVFHNLRRYDGHLLMQEMGSVSRQFGLEISCIARSMEDYLTFQLRSRPNLEEGSPGWNIRFIDSVQFLNSSLDNLVKGMPQNAFKALEKEFEGVSPLLLQKGVYPYDYMNSTDRFAETQLPPKEAFHNRLNNTDINDEQYQHAKILWEFFEAENLGEFHDGYLKLDTCQLADVVERFRAMCLEHYDLDPMHYITLPSFAWDACLKITGISLETIQDPDIYTFLEKGIRGGISVISHRHAKANNPGCPDYDPSKPTTYIIYLDVNNLYGWAMVVELPTHLFRFLAIPELNIDWANTKCGYILEVDLDYPATLHDSHNDYPLAPEKRLPDKLSEYCQQLKDRLGLKGNFNKLIPNLHPKTNYIVHIRNLQLYLSLGMRITAIHRVLAFEQSTWMKPYIMLNTRLRQAATSTFDKNLFKLMNNAVFGKTMENTRAYKEVHLVNNEQQLQKLINNPQFKRSAIFSPDFAGVAMSRVTITLDKPIYVGFSVLDLSKTLMYEFHYNHIKKIYRESQVKLLFTDTDSFIYLIETEDIYADMARHINMYDTSDYPDGHPMKSNTNKKVIGKMTDEMSGGTIYEFVGLRSKMYSFRSDDGVKKRAKGIKKCTVKNDMTFDQYAQALQLQQTFKHSMNLIRSEHHQLHTVKITKSSLSPFDDKRYILNDGISTLAYGHDDIHMLELD